MTKTQPSSLHPVTTLLRLLLHTLVALAAALPPAGALAQTFKPINLIQRLPSGATSIGVTNFPLSPINAYMHEIYPIIVSSAAGIAILMVIIGGMQMMLSGGNESKMQEGRTRITEALIGLVILFFSATILNLLNANFFILSP